MKKKKRKRHHKKVSRRITGRIAALCSGVILVAICAGVGIYGARIAGKRPETKAGTTVPAAETSEPLREMETNETTDADGISETEGAVQYELETVTASEADKQEESAEASAELQVETTMAGDSTEHVATSDIADTGDKTADNESGNADNNGDSAADDDSLLPGAILSAVRLNSDELSQYFTAVPIEAGDAVYNRINGKSWQENEHISLSDLRYLKVLHYNFGGQIQVGELIVNKSIAEDVICVFEELFACGYQIQSMYLIDNYWTGDPDDSDTASIDANNTSAFCYRPITNGTKLSNHAYGLAIDINPQQNPYVSYSSGSPKWYHENANDYIARDTGLPHVITHEDTAFLIFQKYGFTWGGDWNNPKDYQHFEKK